ncbi:hypothetical protein Trydic_g23871 [Trypoxylus dichotomus]
MANEERSIPLTVGLVLLSGVFAACAANEVKGISNSHNSTENSITVQNGAQMRENGGATDMQISTITANRGFPNIQTMRGDNIDDDKKRNGSPQNLKVNTEKDNESRRFVQTEPTTYLFAGKNQTNREIAQRSDPESKNDATTVLKDLIRTIENSIDVRKQDMKESNRSTFGNVSTLEPNYTESLIEEAIERSSSVSHMLLQRTSAQNLSKSDDINNGTTKNQAKLNQTLTAENLAKLQLLLRFIEKDLKKKAKKKAMMQKANKLQPRVEDPTAYIRQELLRKLKAKQGYPKFNMNCVVEFQTGKSNGPEWFQGIIDNFNSKLLSSSFMLLRHPIGFAVGAVAYGRCILNHLIWNGFSAALQNGNPVSSAKESKSYRTLPGDLQTLVVRTRKGIEYLSGMFK